MTLGALRAAVLVVCVGGIAGMIVSSIADVTGAAITFGLITAVAVLSLIAATTVVQEERRRAEGGHELDEVLAEQVEDRIASLVDAGADEAAVRDLAGAAVRLGRGERG
jgi:hypothetical protein